MFARLSRSWMLVKASASVLRQDKELLLFPLISLGALIAVVACFALIAATVCMILRAIEERVGFIGRIVVGLIGMGWSLATYLVVPVLVARDVGPIDAVKESATLFKKTWGEIVIGQVGLGAAF